MPFAYAKVPPPIPHRVPPAHLLLTQKPRLRYPPSVSHWLPPAPYLRLPIPLHQSLAKPAPDSAQTYTLYMYGRTGLLEIHEIGQNLDTLLYQKLKGSAEKGTALGFLEEGGVFLSQGIPPPTTPFTFFKKGPEPCQLTT